jgi:hypothetical protein
VVENLFLGRAVLAGMLLIVHGYSISAWATE